MKKEVLDFVVERTRELMAAPTCSAEAKAAAETWIEAVGTEREAKRRRATFSLNFQYISV